MRVYRSRTSPSPRSQRFPIRTTALVRNYGTAIRDARVRLTVDNRVAGEAQASIGAGQTSELLLPPVAGRAVQVTVDDTQGIEGDNARFLIAAGDGGAGDTRILVVSAEWRSGARRVLRAGSAGGAGSRRPRVSRGGRERRATVHLGCTETAEPRRHHASEHARTR
jgi:hypothetical protein